MKEMKSIRRVQEESSLVWITIENELDVRVRIGFDLDRVGHVLHPGSLTSTVGRGKFVIIYI